MNDHSKKLQATFEVIRQQPVPVRLEQVHRWVWEHRLPKHAPGWRTHCLNFMQRLLRRSK